jgi:hypothetical protein
MILGGASAGASQFWSPLIADVAIQALFQRAGGQRQRLPRRRHLHGLEVQVRYPPAA